MTKTNAANLAAWIKANAGALAHAEATGDDDEARVCRVRKLALFDGLQFAAPARIRREAVAAWESALASARDDYRRNPIR